MGRENTSRYPFPWKLILVVMATKKGISEGLAYRFLVSECGYGLGCHASNETYCGYTELNVLKEKSIFLKDTCYA